VRDPLVRLGNKRKIRGRNRRPILQCRHRRPGTESVVNFYAVELS